MPASRITVLAWLCGGLGLAAWLFYGFALRGQVGEDGMVFAAGVRAWFEGNGARLYDGVWLTGQINERFVSWLAAPLHLHPWIYPPSFLFLLLPLGVLPFGAAVLLCQSAGFAAISWAACGQARARAVVVLSLLLSPATAINILLSQNAFLTGALLAGGARLLPNSPVTAGVLLGLTSYKPQFCLMVPVMLIAGRHWRAAWVAAATAAGLALASMIVLGPDLWRAWLGLLTDGTPLFHDWVHEARVKGMSVYACVILLGGTSAVAQIGQGMAVLLAACVVIGAYRRPMSNERRMAVVLAATFLAAPHAANYDAVLLCLAATLMLSAASEHLRTEEMILAFGVWLCPLFNPPVLVAIGALTPLLVLAFIAVLARGTRALPAARALAAG